MIETAHQLRGAETDARPRTRLRLPGRRTVLLILGPIFLLAGIVWFYLTGGRYVSTDNAYVAADMIELSTDVSGIVREIYVTDNQAVEKGQPLFKLGDAPFRFAVANAQGQVGLARNQVEAMKASYRAQQQQIKVAQVDVDFAQRDWDRKHELFLQHVVPQSAMDLAQQALDGARHKLDAAQQQLNAVLANLGGSPDLPVDQQPTVKAAQATLDVAQHNLNDTVVRAPVAGIVTNVPSLQVGHFLPSSTAAFGLVSGQPWIQANPKETQLTWVRPGQPVTITVDAYPGATWQGKVASLSPASGSQFAMLPAENTSGNWVKVVQRIPVRIAVQPDPSKPQLRAGMSAEIGIDTGHRRTLAGLLASIGL